MKRMTIEIDDVIEDKIIVETNCTESHIESYLHLFRTCLYGLGFHEDTINEYLDYDK